VIAEKHDLDTLPLDGLRILILEDEFLIAMDVEQLCRDHGAVDVLISRTLDGVEHLPDDAFDAAILDMKLGVTSTLGFARGLFESGVPFVFATGYADPGETSVRFPGVPVVTKPYLGTDLVEALAGVARRLAQRITPPR
jgi:DNA-binding response OmpR family regulator